jgi:hypothetical protein
MMDARVKPAHDEVLQEGKTKAPPGGGVRGGAVVAWSRLRRAGRRDHSGYSIT